MSGLRLQLQAIESFSNLKYQKRFDKISLLRLDKKMKNALAIQNLLQM